MRNVCLLGFLAALCVAGQTSAGGPAPLGQLVDVGGYRVHVYCTGSGSPTVMVVGAGFSFDWALVQPEVATFATICTYDTSGMAWSGRSTGPGLTCRERAAEVHKAALGAKLQMPLVVVGLSLGGCVARLYAAEYPAEVAGMVIVDHAFQPEPDPDAKPGKSRIGEGAGLDSPPVLISQTPIEFSVEDGSQFQKLPARARELHRWAMSLKPSLPGWEAAEDCLAELKRSDADADALGNLPLAVVSTGNQTRGYERLQTELMGLSHRSAQLMAMKSFHAVEIDEPEVVVAAIRTVLGWVRKAPH